jgi:hypothetical protein
MAKDLEKIGYVADDKNRLRSSEVLLILESIDVGCFFPMRDMLL